MIQFSFQFSEKDGATFSIFMKSCCHFCFPPLPFIYWESDQSSIKLIPWFSEGRASRKLMQMPNPVVSWFISPLMALLIFLPHNCFFQKLIAPYISSKLAEKSPSLSHVPLSNGMITSYRQKRWHFLFVFFIDEMMIDIFFLIPASVKQTIFRWKNIYQIHHGRRHFCLENVSISKWFKEN
jgi:hypothetical protein